MDALSVAWLSSFLGGVAPDDLAAIALLLLARLLPLVALTPWLAPDRTSWLVTGSVGAMLWITLLPHAVQNAPSPLPVGGVFAIVILREVMLGALFAVVASLPLEALTWAGRLLDRASGPLPWTDAEGAPMSALYRWLGIVLFVVWGGAELGLRAVADGLLLVPLGALVGGADMREMTFTFVTLCTSAIAFGLLLAMPVVLGASLVDVAHLIAQRWFKAWTPSYLWLPTRHVVVIALALLSLSLVASTLPDAYTASMTQARSLWIGLTP